MADNFRGFGRDAPAPRGSDADPLAELARLIGQRAPRPGQDSGLAPAAQGNDDALPQVDWAAGDDAYAEPAHAAHDGYASHEAHDTRWPHDPEDRDRGYDDRPPVRHYGDADPEFEDHGEQHSAAYAADMPRYAAAAREDEEGDDRPHYAARGPYARAAAHDPDLDDDESDTRPHSATALVLAVLGLAVLGSAGAFAYRAMVGGAVVSALPPIIKPAEGPIRVQPNQEAQAGKPGQAEPAAKSGERLVEHQEQPVDVQSANPPVPRVVQTIPVISNSATAPVPGAQSAELNAPGPMPGPAPQQPMASPPFAAPASQAPQAQPPGPAGSAAKQVRTVIIHPGQQAAGNQAPAAPPPAAAIHPARPREAQPAPRPRQSANAGGPLSIVPGPEGEARRAVQNHVTMRAPERVEATSAVGGYAVQVTSQRSEAEAEAAYRALQAKYPQELGGHRPVVRRADLGAKGTYYRALVGPFASAEQASELCGKLKAAGGSCIVQKN